MMTRRFTVALMTAALATATAPLFAADEEAMQRCKEYAKEDGITAAEMAEYLQECMAANSEAAETAGTAEGGKKKDSDS